MTIPNIRDFTVIFVIALVYGIGYSLMKQSEFGFKEAVDPFYFSLTTMSTVGYGDFSPKTRRAKLVVMSQQLLLIISEIAIVMKVMKN